MVKAIVDAATTTMATEAIKIVLLLAIMAIHGKIVLIIQTAKTFVHVIQIQDGAYLHEVVMVDVNVVVVLTIVEAAVVVSIIIMLVAIMVEVTVVMPTVVAAIKDTDLFNKITNNKNKPLTTTLKE